MRKFVCFFLVLFSMPTWAAYSLTGDSVLVEDITVDKPNYYVTIFSHTSSANYRVNLDIWPEKASVVGSFSAKNGTIYWYNSGLIKGKSTYYDCEEESQVEFTIRQINADTCAISGTIQAARGGTMYTYNIAEFRFAYKAGDVPDDPTDDPYRFEPEEATSFSFTGDVVEVRDRLDDRGVIEVTLNAVGDETYHWVELNFMLDTFAMPVGAYTFSSDSTEGTMLASPGYKKKADQPSFVAIRGDLEDWGSYTPYYIIDGGLNFALNVTGDTVYVTGQVTSKNGSTINISVQSYNMFYDPGDKPREPEEVELAIDSVVITYLRNESDSVNNRHFYTFNFFSTSANNYPTVIVDAWLPAADELVEGTYTWKNRTALNLALYQNQEDFESALWGGFPYIFTQYSLTLAEKAQGVWEYKMDIRDTVGSHYWFTLEQVPDIEIYPALDTIPEEDKPYINESKEQVSKQVTFTTMEWDDRTVGKDGILAIRLYEGTTGQIGVQMMAELCFFTSASSVAAGSYPIMDTDAENTFAASIGQYGGIPIPCYIASWGALGIQEIWYLMDGTITMTYLAGNQMQISGTATSYFGSTLTFSYTGTAPTPTALQQPQNTPTLLRKVLRNGRVEIQRNGSRYNILGTSL